MAYIYALVYLVTIDQGITWYLFGAKLLPESMLLFFSYENAYRQQKCGLLCSSLHALICITLTHLPLDNMAAISQTIFSDAFLWMISPNRWQAIIWISADPSNWHIYAALGGDELTHHLPLSWTWITFNPRLPRSIIRSSWLTPNVNLYVSRIHVPDHINWHFNRIVTF